MSGRITTAQLAEQVAALTAMLTQQVAPEPVAAPAVSADLPGNVLPPNARNAVGVAPQVAAPTVKANAAQVLPSAVPLRNADGRIISYVQRGSTSADGRNVSGTVEFYPCNADGSMRITGSQSKRGPGHPVKPYRVPLAALAAFVQDANAIDAVFGATS